MKPKMFDAEAVANAQCDVSRIPKLKETRRGGAMFGLDDLNDIGGPINAVADAPDADLLAALTDAIINLGDDVGKTAEIVGPEILLTTPSLKPRGMTLTDFIEQVRIAMDQLQGAGFSMNANAQLTDAEAEGIAERQLQRSGVRTPPPGILALKKSMSPSQLARFEKIQQRQGKEKSVNASADIDLFLDFMEQKVGQQ